MPLAWGGERASNFLKTFPNKLGLNLPMYDTSGQKKKMARNATVCLTMGLHMS